MLNFKFFFIANSNYSDESQKSFNFNSNLNLTNDKEMLLKNKKYHNILKGKNKFLRPLDSSPLELVAFPSARDK